MTRLLLSLSIFLSIILSTFHRPPQHSLAQEEELAPFIYYFSPNHHAFVIERADGTDSWLLAEDVMPEDQTNIFDMSWSPSGEWFAWWSSENWRANGGQLWIISSNGKTVLDLPTEFDYVFNIEWSPTDDLLVIEYSLYIDDYLYNSLLVYDVDQNETLWSREWSPLEIEVYQTGEFVWSTDGQVLTLMQDCSCENNLEILDIGSLQVHNFTVQGFSSQKAFIASHKNKAFARDIAEQLVAIDLTTFEQTILGDFPYDIELFEWSPDGHQALIMVRTEEHNSYYVWILTTERLIPVEQKILVPFEDPVNLTDMWLPDDQTALVLGTDYNAYWVNTVDGSTKHVPEIPQLSTDNYPQLNSHWSEAYGYIQTEDTFWIYEIATQTFSQITESTYDLGAFAPLPATNGLIYFNNCYKPELNPCLGILNWETELTIELYPDPNLWFQNRSIYGEFVVQDNWILVGSSEVVTNYNFYWSVVQADGTSYRTVAPCSGRNKNCVSWLPKNVDTTHIPANLHAIVYQPRTLAGHQSEVRGVAWSHDGQFIASISQDEIRIWDATTQSTVTVMPHIDDRFATLNTPTEIEWSIDNQYVGVMSNSSDKSAVRIWDIETKELAAEYPDATSFEFIDENTLWVSFPNSPIVVVDLETNQQEERIDLLHYQGVHLLSVSPNQKHVVFWQDHMIYVLQDGWPLIEENADYLQYATKADLTEVWYVESGTVFGVNFDLEKYIRLERQVGYGPLALSPDGRYLLIGLDVWDAQTLTPLYSNYGVAIATAWSPDSRYFASVNAHSVRIWDVEAMLDSIH